VSSSAKSSLKPVVRHLACFDRFSPATVVDVVWSSPKGRHVAVITENGTAHLYVVPAAAFAWPPPRRARIAKNAGKGTRGRSSSHGKDEGQKGSMLDNAKQVFKKRSISGGNNTFSSFSNLSIMPASAGKAAKSSAAALGKAVAAGAKSYIHSGDNKLSLPKKTPNHDLPVSGCARWLTGNMEGYLTLANHGTLQIYRVKERYETKEEKEASASGTRKVVIEAPVLRTHYDLPYIRETLLSPVVAAYLDRGQNEGHPAAEGCTPDEHAVADDPEDIGKQLEGEWKLRRPSNHIAAGDSFSNLPLEGEHHQQVENHEGGVPVDSQAPQPSRRTHDRSHPLSHAEIQTLAPFVSFSADPKVSIFKYIIHSHDQHGCFHEGQHQQPQENEPWCFGNEIAGQKILVRKEKSLLSKDLNGNDMDGMDDEEFELLDGEWEGEGDEELPAETGMM